ncbi:sterol desaturase family protein [Panacibacter ginsenosidivorans]|uniref:Sterol desaturase family protein n=1 Tax=Panacibacter ginsenosidivorans TaxID=1813871 RepID=A0A5B8VES0_9BACT|nr:sterol desaturase family protein [Panacibacter ginsenosidivorans]QEC69565.1 sterol desaturase family protein [Panacibacter ginsenosidivorans]
MDILKQLYDEVIGFFGIGHWVEMMQKNDYSSLLTFDGVIAAIGPLIPLILLIEIFRAIFYKKFKMEEYKIPFIIFVANRFISRFIAIAAVAFCIGLFEKYAIFKTGFTWYWLIYGYIVWELAHFVYHYLGHKVRLFWCLHSTHHAPETMNLSVTFAHFFLEAPYADFIRTSICILLGVNPPLLFFIMFIDGTWGAFIHVGENFMKDARMGFLNKIILTPSHHRVHHAKNPLYMDTNFCNLLNIWDRMFGTFQYEDTSIPIQYGITRKINAKNFWDVYFGEIYYLFLDMKNAPGITNKLLYMIMPPGWSHTGDHKTAAVIKKKLKEEKETA